MPRTEQIAPEKRENVRRHQFGQPEGNPQCPQSIATNQREFYRWCETKATEADLRAYVEDESNPAARRRFVATLLGCETLAEFFALTNQTHGMPKQQVEVSQPAVEIVDFGI